jgi:hypothetical protein
MILRQIARDFQRFGPAAGPASLMKSLSISLTGGHNRPCKHHSRDYFPLENGATDDWKFNIDNYKADENGSVIVQG